jgi:hypothetical protein
MMLGVTTYLTTDIAAVPLLWVLPLALYLVSFILVFARLPGSVHTLMVLLLPVMIVLLIVPTLYQINVPTEYQLDLGIGGMIGLHLGVFFVAAMVCHGEVARARPPAAQLTEYYLWISVGGVLGGVFNALVAPLVFDRVVEYPLMIVLVCVLRPHLGRRQPANGEAPKSGAEAVGTLAWLLFAGFTGVLLYFISYGGDWDMVWHMERNFFGVLSVQKEPRLDFLNLRHGTTIHGLRSLDPARRDEPLGYYHRTGPIGQVFAVFDGPNAKDRVAVIGLGVGALANYAAAGQHWDFFEIDPAVERIAREPGYFPFLDDSEKRGVILHVVLGDARLKLADADGDYGILVMDAFSSDSIPVHLLTREALGLYLRKLAPDGVLAMHLSNQYLLLAPVVADLARDAGLICLYQEDVALSQEETEDGKFPSKWAVLARRTADVGRLAVDRRWQRLDGRPGRAVWTDDFSNLLSVVSWKRQAVYGLQRGLRRGPGR